VNNNVSLGASDPHAVTIPGRLLISTEGWNRVLCPHATLLSRPAISSPFVNGAPPSDMPPTELVETTGCEECFRRMPLKSCKVEAGKVNLQKLLS